METNFFGPLNVTRAVLPVMRGSAPGQVVTMTSTAGHGGQEFCAAYAASKFALEGWMESLPPEVAPYGIRPCSSSRASSAPNCSSRALDHLAEPNIDDYTDAPGRRSRRGSA